MFSLPLPLSLPLYAEMKYIFKMFNSRAVQVHAKLGYCPQIDALIDQMTGRETLTMYARLKGVPARHIERIVKNLLDIFLLRRHADKFISYYRCADVHRRRAQSILLIIHPSLLNVITCHRFCLVDRASAHVATCVLI